MNTEQLDWLIEQAKYDRQSVKELKNPVLSYHFGIIAALVAMGIRQPELHEIMEKITSKEIIT